MRSQTSPFKCILRCTLPILCASILFNIPRFFDLRIQLQGNVDEGNSTNATRSEEYLLEGTEWRGNKYFVLWYVNVKTILFAGMTPFLLLIYLYICLYLYICRYVNVTTILFTGLIPLVLLIYFNGQLILKRKSFIQRQLTRRKSSVGLQKYKKQSDNIKIHTQQAIILHAIVIVLVLCHALRIILNINEWIMMEDNIKAREMGCYNVQLWSTLAAPVSHLFLQINSAANFFIYSIFNATFAKVLKEKLKDLIKCCNAPAQRLVINKHEPIVKFRNSRTQSSRISNCSNLEGVVVNDFDVGDVEIVIAEEVAV